MRANNLHNSNRVFEKKKSRRAILRKTSPPVIGHGTVECQRKAIMCIRKMQALRNEMPEQKSQDGSRRALPCHESAAEHRRGARQKAS